MPLSLKSHLKKFVHKGQITQEEYDALIKKLDGHDKEVRAKAIDEFAEKCKANILCRTFGLREVDIDVIAAQLKTEV